MNRDDIIRMAIEAEGEGNPHGMWRMHLEDLERFAALVAAAEREACARVQRLLEEHQAALEANEKPEPWPTKEVIDKAVAREREACARVCDKWGKVGEFIAAAIRARSGEPEPALTSQERTPDYLEKCPNCNGPADNGFDRSWPDPNPYFCTKCMEAMEY